MLTGGFLELADKFRAYIAELQAAIPSPSVAGAPTWAAAAIYEKPYLESPLSVDSVEKWCERKLRTVGAPCPLQDGPALFVCPPPVSGLGKPRRRITLRGRPARTNQLALRWVGVVGLCPRVDVPD